MPSIVILGAGITGLSVANSLPEEYEITIVARDHPGDPDSLNWASPWAGAGFGGGAKSNEQILRKSFEYFWDLAETHPESTVRKIPDNVFRDDTDTDEDLWWKGYFPNYRVMDPSELPPYSRARIALAYTTIVMTPKAYLDWLHRRLIRRGVKFQRATIAHISELLTVRPKVDVIVNASGVGAGTLGGVMDADVIPIRGQTIVMNDPERRVDKMVFRTGDDYCYIIPRLDGSVVLGGIEDYNDTDGSVRPEQRADIAKRCHELLPLIPEDPKDIDIIQENVGIRPGRKSGLRVESEIIDGLKVVHAYGSAGGGFAMSPGLGMKVTELVDESLEAK